MTSLPLYPTLAVGAATAVVWYFVSRWQQRKRLPPGPFPLPVVGNLLAFYGDKKAWTIFDDMSKKHGNVFTFFFGTIPTVILNDLESVREAFLTKQNDFAGRAVTYSFDVFTKGGKDIAGGQFGPVWKKQRKIAHAAMRKFATGDCLEKLIHENFKLFYAALDKAAEAGEKFDPAPSMTNLIHNIIFSMVFGRALEENDPVITNYIKLNEEMTKTLSSGLVADFIPWFKYIPTSGRNLLHRGVNHMFKLVDDIYEGHQNDFNESDPKDIVDFMIQTIKEVENEEGLAGTEGLTEDHYKLIILDIFSAGTETTTLTLKWVMLYLAAFPDCQKKIHEELDIVLGKDEKVRLEHRPQLPYTEAFLHEVMRIRPIAPLSLAHETMCDTSVGGHAIPAGTMIVPNFWMIHMDKEIWGDPEVFRPERFLGEDGKMGPRISAWLPFSTGRRVCVGEAVAKAELNILLAAVMQRYSFQAPPGVEMDLSIVEHGQEVMPNKYELMVSKRT